MWNTLAWQPALRDLQVSDIGTQKRLLGHFRWQRAHMLLLYEDGQERQHGGDGEKSARTRSGEPMCLIRCPRASPHAAGGSSPPHTPTSHAARATSTRCCRLSAPFCRFPACRSRKSCSIP